MYQSRSCLVRYSSLRGDCSREREPVTPRECVRRVRLVEAALCGLALLVAVRLIHLQHLEHGRWSELAAKQYGGEIQIQGARGSLLDSAGRTLAVSVESLSVGLHPKKVKDRLRLVQALLPILKDAPDPVGADELEQKLSSEKNFVWVARSLPRENSKALLALQEQGISVVKEFRRVYPQGAIAAPIIGRVGRDGSGLSGVELAFDELLSAPNTHVAVRRDALGRLVTADALNTERVTFVGGATRLFKSMASFFPQTGFEFVGPTSPKVLAPSFREDGGVVRLTIDTVVQEVIEDEFLKAAGESGARKVYGVVLDADNGNVLGMAQYPRLLDPNREQVGSAEQLKNYVLQDTFEPGSTFKPLVAAAGVDAGLVSLNEVMDCENGAYRVGGRTVRDVHPVGVATFRDVLVRSSNICMAKLGQRLGKKRLADAVEALGFGKKSGIEIRGEAKGIVRDRSTWREIDIATASFGQGVAVTSLQLVRAYAALANGGYLVQPTLLRSAYGYSPATGEHRERIFKNSTARQISDALVGVTEDEHGTGRAAAIEGVHVFGKTGTAQKARVGGRGYDPNKILSSFIGYLNGNEVGVDRRLVMLVVVDEPQTKIRYGGVLAAPVFQRSMQRILSYLISAQGGVLQRVDAADRAVGRG